jgi:hypothetical protein
MHYTSDLIKKDEMGMVHTTCGRVQQCVQNTGDRPAGKRPLGRSRHVWENGIKMDLEEMRWQDVDWNHVAWDREQWVVPVNIVMNLWIPKKFWECLE